MPFSNEIGDHIPGGLQVISETGTITEAAEIMALSNNTSLVVLQNDVPVGIVTISDLVKKGLARKISTDSAVSNIMTPNIITIQKDQPVLEALVVMLRHKIGHLLVMDGKTILGVVSEKDWLNTQKTNPATIIQSINYAKSVQEIAQLKKDAYQLITRLFDIDGNAHAFTQFITEINDKITSRLIGLAISEMRMEGYGDPPVTFAWIGMGSEGRKAQTLITDQDNGIIFENVAPEHLKVVYFWFHLFARKVVNGLEVCGFPKCDGNIMATNSELCNSVAEWKILFNKIITIKDAKTLLEASIYFDFRLIYGNSRLVTSLWDDLITKLYANILFFRRFADNMLMASRPPIKSFRWKWYPHFKLKVPQLNIKREAIAPLDAAVRILSLANGSIETNTIERLKFLEERKIITRSLAEAARSAYDFMMILRIRYELNRSSDDKIDYIIGLNSLNPLMANFLKDSLNTIYSLQAFAFEKVGGVNRGWGIF